MFLAVLAKFIKWNGVKSFPKYGLEVDFKTFWDAIISVITLLLVNDLLKTNCSKRLGQPYIDLRHIVHLKHQSLISEFSKFQENKYVGFQIFSLFVYRTQF